MSDDERRALGGEVRIPSSLSEALEALKKDSEWAKKALGEEFFSFYLKIKEQEVEAESKKGEKERKQALVRTF